MPEEVEAGRLHLDVVTDATGLRRDLQAKAKTAAEGVRARVRAEAEFRASQVRASLNEALREGVKSRPVTARVSFDAKQARTALNAALREGTKGSAVKARVAFDARQARNALNTALREGTRGAAVKARVEFTAVQARNALNTALQEGTKGSAVKARVEFTAVQARNALNAALREGTRATAVKARVEFDPVQIRNALNRALLAGVRANPVTARVNFDVNQVRNSLNTALNSARSGARIPNVDVDVDGDTSPLRRDVDAARRSEQSRPINVPVRADSSSLMRVAQALRAAGGALTGLTMFPTIASGILIAAGALTNLVGGLYAVVAAASQAVGVLAVLPGLAFTAAQGLSALLLGFAGIGKAVGELGKAQQATGQAAAGAARQQKSAARQAQSAAKQQRAAARQQEAAAERIRSARQRLVDTRRTGAEQIAETEKRAAQRIADAEQRLASSHENLKRAQDNLTRARVKAKEALQQLEFQSRGAWLSVEQAEINLERAEHAAIAARQNATMSPIDKRQAELDYRQAMLDIQEARDRAVDLSKENKKAQKDGVEGAEDVKEAKEDVRDVEKEIKAAEKEVKDARKEGAKEVAKAKKDAARQIAEAQRDLTRAMKDARDVALDTAASAADMSTAMTGATASAANLTQAMDKLSPAGQRFARFIHGQLLPRIKEMRWAVQEAMLPGLQRGLKAAFPLLKVLQKQFVRSGVIIGRFGEKAGRLAGSAPFRKDTEKIMSANNEALEAFTEAGLHLANALRDVMVVASPMLVDFAELVERWAKGRSEAAKLGRDSGRMAAYFERAWKTGGKLSSILGDLWAGLMNIGHAAVPVGNGLLDSMVAGAEAFRAWTADEANQERMREWFEQTVPVLKAFAELLGQIGVTLGKLAEATGGDALAGLFAVLNTFLDVLNAIADMPGGGTILTTIFLLAGAGLGLGLVVRALGGILRNLALLGRYTGLSALMRRLRGLRGGIDDLTESIDKELPKDKAKKDALDDVGDSADKSKKKADKLGDSLDDVGDKAKKSAKKTSLLSRMWTWLKDGIGGLLLALPGIGMVWDKIRGMFSRGAKDVAKDAKGTKGGLLTGFFSNLFGKFKLPGFGAILERVKGWFAGLAASIAKLGSKMFSGAGATKLLKGGATKGLKGGGPLGILAGITGGLLGGLIGGGEKGIRGALGGAVSGAATGGGIGATLGSVFPVIGTGVVGAIGAALGAVVGAITGGGWWEPIKTFFLITLPNFIFEQVSKLPGLLMSGLSAVGNWLGGLASWVGGQLASFASWVGRTLLLALQKIPVLIVDMLFAIPRLLAWAFNKVPDVFGWIVKSLWKAHSKVLHIVTSLPGWIIGGLVKGFLALPDLFAWLWKQAQAGVAKAGEFLAGLPGWTVELLVKGFQGIPWLFGWLGEQAGRGLAALPGLFNSALAAVGRAISRGLGDAGKRAQQHMAEMTKNYRDGLAKWGKNFRDAFVSIRDGIIRRFTTVRDRLGEMMDSIKRSFSRGVDNLKELWNGLGKILATPVNWIGNNVYGRGIKWIWDRVAALVDKGPLPPYKAFARGGVNDVLPGYTPGQDVHHFYSPTGGRVDMSGGEAIMVPEWARAVGVRKVYEWNAIARSGGPKAVAAAMVNDFTGGRGQRYARGGVQAGPVARFDIGGIWDGIKSFGASMKNYFTDGLAKAANAVLNPILGAVPDAMGGGQWGAMLSGLPRIAVGNFTSWLTKSVEPKIGGDAKGVVAAAKSMIGRGDDRGPNNNFITRKWGWPAGTPWCALFVSEAIQQAKAQKFYPGYPSAAVAAYVGAMKHTGLGEGRPGDLAAYRGDGHINIIERNLGNRRYQTIGGNENALIRRSEYLNATSILRPKFARGGVFARDILSNASRLFLHEAPRQKDRHEMQTPLVSLMNRIPHRLIEPLTMALAKTRTTVSPQALVRDSGGPIPPGSYAYNGLSKTEWVLTPEAVDLLGGGRAVAALNVGAGNLYRSSRSTAPAVPHRPDSGSSRPDATVNVYPQPMQSEHEIGVIAARKLGVMLQ